MNEVDELKAIIRRLEHEKSQSVQGDRLCSVCNSHLAAVCETCSKNAMDFHHGQEQHTSGRQDMNPSREETSDTSGDDINQERVTVLAEDAKKANDIISLL